jgi:hypothetical protein
MAAAQPPLIFPKHIIAQLDGRRSEGVAPYVIYYGLRTPPHGRCFLGWDGVDDESLIDSYAAAMRRAYDYFRGQGWVAPRVDPALGHIPVYVYNAPKPGASRRGDYTILILRSEIVEPTLAGCLMQAEIEACHEVVHTFTHVHRPLKGLKSDNWKRDEWAWFDEATAVYFERELCPGNQATLSYARWWVNQPEQPVEFTTGYAAAWLVQHLVRVHGPDFLRDVWQQARPHETPVVAINRLLGRRGTFEDLVYHYSVSSYRTETMDPHAAQRFGCRRFSYVARLTGDLTGPASPPWDDTLGPLGCRYYKIDPGRAARPVTLHIEVHPKSTSSLAGLRAEAILEPPVAAPAGFVPLRQAITSEGASCLQADVSLNASVSHVVLTVVNTESGVPLRAHDRAYDVRVTA